MAAYTLQAQLDHYLGLPRKGQAFGHPCLITSEKRIRDGKVQYDGITCTDPNKVVAPGHHIRWGMTRYQPRPQEFIIK